MTGHFYNALSMCISKNKFESLTPELKEIFFKAAVEAGQEQRVFVGENEGRLLEKMKEAGLIINNDVDKAAMRAAVQPIYDEYQNNVSKEMYEKAMKLLAEE
jgi:TRAP-type C4-dicarboxylate transport system substrate-binding protein